MALNNMKLEKVTFPLSVFETANTKEDLEDWLLSQRDLCTTTPQIGPCTFLC
jgi:hypothetical protein